MKTNYAAKRITGRLRRRWILIACVFVILIGGICFSLSIAKRHPERFAEFSQHVAKVKQWFVERKGRLQNRLDKKISTIKELSANKDANQDVHFEFYTALPAMQISVSHADEKIQTNSTLTTTEPKKSLVLSTPSVKAPAAKSLFLDPAELERDFANRVSQRYVIQLGIFSTLKAANAFRQSVKIDHYNTEVIKAYVGERQMYRVQLGSFVSKELVETMQRDLRKKGMDGIVRKVS